MDWFLYDNGHRNEGVKRSILDIWQSSEYASSSNQIK